MEREEIVKELHKVLNAVDITFPYRLELINAIEYLSEPSLPVDLEEAAMRDSLEYVDSIPDGGTDKHPWNDHDVEKAYYDGMLAGVEWGAEHAKK